MYPFELSPCTAVLSEAWAKLRDWASVAGRGQLLLSGSVAHASLKTAVLTSYFCPPAQNMTVPDVHSGERLSSYAALARWMEGQVVHAADGLDVENPTCP